MYDLRIYALQNERMVHRLWTVSFFLVLLLANSCTEKSTIVSQSVTIDDQATLDTDRHNLSGQLGDPSFRVGHEGNPIDPDDSGQKVGVFYMPSWDAASGLVFWETLLLSQRFRTPSKDFLSQWLGSGQIQRWKGGCTGSGRMD